MTSTKTQLLHCTLETLRVCKVVHVNYWQCSTDHEDASDNVESYTVVLLTNEKGIVCENFQFNKRKEQTKYDYFYAS